MMIAAMVANPPEPDAECMTTLVVATPSLIDQWMAEFNKHVEPGVIGPIVKWHGNSKMKGGGALDLLKKANVYVVISSRCRS